MKTVKVGIEYIKELEDENATLKQELEQVKASNQKRINEHAETKSKMYDQLTSLQEQLKQANETIASFGNPYYEKMGHGLKGWPREDLEDCITQDTQRARAYLEKYNITGRERI